ncbi:MAG TPA: CinA family protein [Stellaceae bacterium]|nr:CinA family protein [Stellaceae bacterium]
MLQDLLPHAERIAAKLKARGETVSVAESSTAGLVSAALLAVPGASAYFIGGAVVYTRVSRSELLRVTDDEFAAMKDITPSTEPYALLFARKIGERLHTDWTVGETGTAGPTGSRYGHKAGHSCIAVIGPAGERSITVETGDSDRVANMRAFSLAALDLLEQALG